MTDEMFRFQVDSDGIGVLTIANPEGRLNILSFDAMRELDEVLGRLVRQQEPRPVGLVIISGKPDNFVVGVDVREFLRFETADDGTAASREGWRIFRQIAELPYPSVAAINGTCLGGGLELALNCTSRVISDHPKTVLGLPEVKLGILPGAGGAEDLPRLVGVQAGLEMMVTGKNVYPRKAVEMGLADEIVSPGVLLEAARKRVQTLNGQAAGRRRKGTLRKRPLGYRLLDGPLKGLVYRQVGRKIMAQTQGHYPAPLEILRLVRKSLGRPSSQGLKLSARAFGQLAMSEQCRALTHIFFADSVNRKSRGELAQPSATDRIGIVGAGLMGAGIATVCLDRGLTVRQKDRDYDALARGRSTIQRTFEGRIMKRITSRREADLKLTRYSSTTDYSGFRRSDLVIEAVFEGLALKRQVVAELEDIVGPETVIATNTSSLPIGEIAQGAAHPERIIGMHFFSPVEKMPLVEITPGSSTGEQALATALNLARRLGKTAIVVKDSPGFYVNRILTPYFNETFKLLEDGLAVDVLDRYVRKLGFPVGPCTLLDEVGLDVTRKVAAVMQPFIGERLEMADHNQRLIADNRLGRKNGRGFYLYTHGKKGGVDGSVYGLLNSPRRQRIPYAEVRARLLYGMLNEAAHALAEGVIARPDIGDIGAIYGFGFPPYLGGPYWAMDQMGLPALVEALRGLEEQHGRRFAPASGLVMRAEAGQSYDSD